MILKAVKLHFRQLNVDSLSGDGLQAHSDLQLQFDNALQQLFQLSYALQAFAVQNSTHGQQLQIQQGVTSKVRGIEQFLQHFVRLVNFSSCSPHPTPCNLLAGRGKADAGTL